MAESRRQLINASSFFQREEGKFGGFSAKKSTISGSSFKKGSSLGNVVGQESDVGKLARILRDTRGKTLVNEKKITLLKKVSNLRKDNQQEKVNSPLLESLQAIAATTDSIRNTLIRQQDFDEDTAERMRIAREKADRDKQEKGLESKPGVLAKIGNKFVQPVMGLFEKIFNFIKTLLFGKFLMNFLDWFSNPDNQGKIASFVRFIKDWWPALTAAVLLFGTGFTSLAAGLVKIVAGFTVKLVALVPKLLAALAKLKLGKLLKMIPGAGLLKGGLILGGGVLATYGIGKMLNKDKEAENLAAAQNQSTEKLISEGMDSGEAATTSQSVVTGDSNRMTDTNLRSNNNMLQTGMNDPLDGGFSRFNKGGQVPGSGNTDTVPAMLTPGEFVMSKGAVQQYGSNLLASMNAAAGGDNKPKYKDGKVHAFGGGKIDSYEKLIEKGGFVEDNNYGNMRDVKVLFPEKRSGLFGRKRTRRTNNFLIQGGEEMNMPIEDFINMKLFDGGSKATEKAENTSISSGLGVGAVKDMVNMKGYKKPDIKPSTKSKSGSSGILGPISSDVNAMVNSSNYEVKSKTPKNTVVAYEQEVNKNQKQKTAPASGGNEIPSFDVAPIRDPLKMVTLQIVLF
jgi:hypothetical protein